MHISTDDASMKKIGVLPSGGDCIINKIAAEADLLISEGFIEAHFFAGFPAAESPSCQVLLPIKQLWLITAENLLMTKNPAQVISAII